MSDEIASLSPDSLAAASAGVRLADRAVLAVSGPDAATFLNNLVSANIETLADGDAAHATLLSPQGKILFDFFVARSGDLLLIDVDGASAPSLLKRLQMYRLRADVRLENRDDLAVVAFADAPAVRDLDVGNRATDAVTYADPRLQSLGFRAILPAVRAPAPDAAAADEVERRRIGLAIAAFGRDFKPGDVVPHDVNYDQFPTIDFRKGCYVGQEIVSRMKHRNTARKRLVHARATGPNTVLPPPGTEIRADFRLIGAMGTAFDGNGLAIVRLDWAHHAMETGVPITADGVALQLDLPAYAGFGWPTTIVD